MNAVFLFKERKIDAVAHRPGGQNKARRGFPHILPQDPSDVLGCRADGVQPIFIGFNPDVVA